MSKGQQGIYNDLSSKSNIGISYEHYEIHNGSHFFLYGAEDLSINQVMDFTIQTPNTTKWLHWTWEIDTQSETNWYVYENAIVTNALSEALTPFNNNRNSAKTSGATVKYEVQASLAAANADTNVTSPAILIESGISGSGRTAGDDARNHELILKQNTIYCLRAVATAAGFLDFAMQWYEHTNNGGDY